MIPHLPPGAELDQLQGNARLSLVAFEFNETRFHGLPVPGCRSFPEINLRFYVRYQGERGVVFIRELVPRRLIAYTARLRYNEPYRWQPMQAGHEELGENRLRVWHRFGPDRRYSLEARTDGHEAVPADESSGYWLTHHTLGLGRTRQGQLRRYHVEHPVWALQGLEDVKLRLDFGALYGPEWSFLNQRQPDYTSYATGSTVAVYPPL